MALATELAIRGNDVAVVGDAQVAKLAAGLGYPTIALPARLDLGPRLVDAIRHAMSAAEGDHAAAGPYVEEQLAQWSRDMATPTAQAIDQLGPDVVITSLFGVEVLDVVAPSCPWVVVNSTFYLGPGAPRRIEQDVAPRAVPLLRRYANLLSSASLVLHATDQVFDYGLDRLPARHHYVGPLGTWEPPGAQPAYVAEPGDPWVLVGLSTQLQDDLPLARSAINALADEPVRVLLTIGPDHRSEEIGSRPANVWIENSVPHSAVLPASKLLVSHAGHGTVMKALWYGVPMLLVPWGRDQPGVAARAEALGVATVCARESADAATLKTAAQEMLASDSYVRAAQAQAVRLHGTNPRATAADMIQGAHKE